jgi:hypothetical protein
MKIIKHIDLDEAITFAFQSTAQEFADKNEEIISNARQWSGDFGVTQRRSGQVVFGGYRNIVDLGNLRDSQNVSFLSPLKAQLTWDGNGNTPAALQYFGWTTRTGKRVPGRPWVREALRETDLPNVYIANFKASL